MTVALMLGQLRRAAALISHVGQGELTGVVRAADGTERRVGDRAGRGCESAAFRAAVAEARAERSLHPVQTLLDLGDTPLIDVAVEDGETLVRLTGNRWRRQTPCHTTDYLLAIRDLDHSLAMAEGSLGEALATPARHLRALRDADLGFTVVALDWPRSLGEADRAQLEQAVRDLAVMWRVRANLEQLEQLEAPAEVKTSS